MSTADRRATRTVLLVAGLGHVCAGAFELMLPTLAVVVAQQTAAPIERVIAWTGLAYLLYGIGALPGGVLADRLPARLLLVTAIFGCGVAALAASEAPSGRVLSLCLAVMGLCASLCRPAGLALIQRTAVDWRAAQRAATWAGRAAMIAAPFATAALGTGLGWHGALRAIGYTLCAAAVAAAFLAVRERPPARAEPDRVAAGTAGIDLLALTTAALAALTALGVALVEPAYFASRVGAIGFGAATSAVMAAGFAGRAVLGRATRRYDRYRAMLIWQVAALVALLLMAASAEVPLLAVAAVFAACSLAGRAIADRLLMLMFADRRPATAYGLAAASTGGIAAAAAWIVAASAAVGLSIALLWLAAVNVLAVVAAAWLVAARPGAPADMPAAAAPRDPPLGLLVPRSRPEPPRSC